MIKVLFLDFDGVICTSRAATANGEKGVLASFDTVAMRFLDRMCRDYGIKIVISSTWRKHHKQRTIYELFASAGYYALGSALYRTSCGDSEYYGDETYSWRTPERKSSTNRGIEIKDWLESYHWDDYLILDDDSDMLKEQLDRFIKIDTYEGITFMDMVQIEKWCKNGTTKNET